MTNPAPGFKENPYHKVEISPLNRKVQIYSQGVTIASTDKALSVKESGLPEVFYIPFDDVKQKMLIESKTTSYCPFKGQASYWSIQVDSNNISDAAWQYKDPYDECRFLKGHIAFYSSKVDII
ncbi:DUF427 domain-containing protein [Microbulbifer sp. SSSA007]|uniref:DUF427 domain-containing protein n=1 Tax=Microbulbifer sp. SSSA007 TaxID=3243379 RepID=UPI0040393C37